MYDVLTVCVVVQRKDLRERVSSILSADGHDVLPMDDAAAVDLQNPVWREACLIIADEANAETCIDLVSRLPRVDEGGHLPVLALIGRAADAAALIEHGADDVVREPIVEAELRARVGVHVKLQEVAEQYFRELFEHSPIGVFRMAADGRLLVANPAFVRMLGYNSFAELRNDVPSHIRSSIPPSEPHVAESVWVRKDSTPVHVLQRTYPVTRPDGNVRYFEGILEDLSERHMIEESLKEHATRLSLALDAAQMGDFEYDIKTDEFECAFLVYRLLGYREEPTKRDGSVLFRRVHPDDVEALQDSIQTAIEAGTPWQHEFRVVWPDETLHWLVARGEVLLDSDRTPRRVIGVLRDATAEKKLRLDLIAAKQEAENMARLKSTFLANMSHEIRTPLTAIIGFASLLANRVPEEHRTAVHRIQQGGQRLLDTLNAVLTLARLESHQLSLDLEDIDIAAEARSALQMFDFHARDKGIRLRFVNRISGGPARARVDRGALASILQNLIGNAIKFTEKGHVEVAVRLDPVNDAPSDSPREFVWVDVSDTGRGIDETFLPHIFDVFRQESTGMRREHDGAGLGLAIVRRLAEALGGVLSVRSTPGTGSTFSVGFPAERPSPKRVERRSTDGSAELNGRRPSLLVVEDNEDTRELLQALLQDRFVVTLAENAQEALRCATKQPFDLVLMDINLGEGIGGEEVAAVLRERPEYRDVPIIALTAYGLPGDAERFLNVGFTAHLAKPFKPESLFDLLEKSGG